MVKLTVCFSTIRSRVAGSMPQLQVGRGTTSLELEMRMEIQMEIRLGRWRDGDAMAMEGNWVIQAAEQRLRPLGQRPGSSAF